MADEAKGKFTELCDQIYNNKIKCAYVSIVDNGICPQSTCTSGSGTAKKATHDCVEGDLSYSEGNCVCIGGTSPIEREDKIPDEGDPND